MIITCLHITYVHVGFVFALTETANFLNCIPSSRNCFSTLHSLHFQERLQQLEKDKAEADSMRKEKEALKIAAEELENVALEKYRKIEEETKQKEQEEEKRASEQEAFEYFHKLDANQDGK